MMTAFVMLGHIGRVSDAWRGLVLAVLVFPALAQESKPPTASRDCEDCPEMVVVPGGTFRMGSPRDRALSDSEIPRHEVTIAQAFAVSRFEVTRGQFAAFVKDSGYAGFAGKGCTVLKHDGLEWADDSARDWRDPGFAQSDDHPVVCVNLEDAIAYTDWLAKKTGEKYRLLSEAEWEFAALAGSRNLRPWGDDEKAACKHANVWDETYQKERGFPRRVDSGYQNRSAGTGPRFRDAVQNPLQAKAEEWYLETHWCSDAYSFTAPVGTFEANRYGLHDMIGNVWEWVEDCLNMTYTGAPKDGSVWTNGNCDSRVLRGGSWTSVPSNARAVQRFFLAKSVRRSDLGIRIAKSL